MFEEAGTSERVAASPVLGGNDLVRQTKRLPLESHEKTGSVPLLCRSQMNPAQRRWHKIRVMWKVGILMHTFVSAAEEAAELKRQYEKELEEARMAKLKLDQEKEEAE